MSNPLDDLFWRDEILQIMYWYQGEGFGEEVTEADLIRFLDKEAPSLDPYLLEMSRDGWLEPAAGGRYRLTAMGHQEGARRFADAFEDLTKPGHGECSADCDCQGDPTKCKHYQPDHAHNH